MRSSGRPSFSSGLARREKTRKPKTIVATTKNASIQRYAPTS